MWVPNERVIIAVLRAEGFDSLVLGDVDVTLDHTRGSSLSSYSQTTSLLKQPAIVQGSDAGNVQIESEGRFHINPSLSEMKASLFGEQSDCADGSGESIRIVQSVLREPGGSLLAAAGLSVLRHGGNASMASNLPEITMQWEDLGCSACDDEYAAGAAALRVTWGGATATVLPAERATFVLGTRRYGLKLTGASRPPSANSCGWASWGIVREDFLQRE